MNRIVLALGLSVILASSVASADEIPSGPRLALLLGNADYQDGKLPGVSKSLDRVEQACTAQGFRVVQKENLNEKELKAAVEEFALSVPTNGVALVYYVGLGANVERLGKHYNLLRPIKASIQNDNDYRSRALDVQDVIKLFREESGARVTLMFLDACWQSPIKPASDKVRGGLHEFEVEKAMVMFAAQSGQAIPTPKKDQPSALATSLASHLEKMDQSVQSTCEAMSTQLGKAWFGGAQKAGIGSRSSLPMAETLREGKTAGEGFVNSVGMAFRWCPPGSFTMGSERTDSPATRDRKPVKVTLSRGYWMGEYEVTQREYDRVMRKNVGRGFTIHKNAPFWGISEPKKVEQFCDKLSDLERKAGTLPAGWKYVCPTEAEWEYACRAGSTSAYCFGDSVAELGLYGNFADRALQTANPNYLWADPRSDDGVGEALAPVGNYRPNAWGLRDMHGNVAEVVADHLLPELPGGKDPLVRVKKNGRTVVRGGAWCSLPLYCESSFRNGLTGRDKHNFVGFRIALKKVK